MQNQLAVAPIAPTANCVVAGQDFFFAITINVPSASSTDVFSGAANQVRAAKFILDFPATIAKVSVNVTTADAVNTVADCGIYDASGNRLAYTNGGISVAATGLKTVNLVAAVSLPPGTYYFAYCSKSSTAAATALGSSGAIGNFLMPNAWGNAANAATNGVLPATLGVISNVGLNPVCAKFEP